MVFMLYLNISKVEGPSIKEYICISSAVVEISMHGYSLISAKII